MTGCRLEEITLAEALRAAGYQTAFLGKWHLGRPKSIGPRPRALTINVGGHDRGSPPGGYFAPTAIRELPDGPRENI